MRIYVPATMADLAVLQRDGYLGAPIAFAVTEAFAAAYGPAEDEEYEHSLMCAAAAASRAAQGPSWRRVVIAADVTHVDVVEAAQGQVAVAGPIPMSAVVSIHVDERVFDDELADDDAADLQWFATQELDDVVKGEVP